MDIRYVLSRTSDVDRWEVYTVTPAHQRQTIASIIQRHDGNWVIEGLEDTPEFASIEQVIAWFSQIGIGVD
jgi:hypothetical protein